MTPTRPKPVRTPEATARPTRGPSDSGRWYWMGSGRDPQRGEKVSFAIGWATREEAAYALRGRVLGIEPVGEVYRPGPTRFIATGSPLPVLDDPGLARRLWGGARPNSGPKPVAGVARSEGALVRLTPDEVERFLAARPGSALATAVRDMALVGLAAVEQARETTPDSKTPTRAATRAKRAKPGSQP